METMVIVGAGKGLGLSLAKRFGRENFRIALIARNEQKLKSLVAELKDSGIEASYFVADLYDKQEIVAAFANIKEKYGAIDVLEFSPTPGNTPPTSVLNLTDEMALEQFNGIVVGAINSVNQVLPDMIKRGSGALLFTTGLSAMFPVPMMGNVGIALSGLRNYVANLHTELKQKGIYVGHLSLGVFMKPNSGTVSDPDTIADAWYQMYFKKEKGEEAYPVGVTPATVVF